MQLIAFFSGGPRLSVWPRIRGKLIYTEKHPSTRRDKEFHLNVNQRVNLNFNESMKIVELGNKNIEKIFEKNEKILPNFN